MCACGRAGVCACACQSHVRACVRGCVSFFCCCLVCRLFVCLLACLLAFFLACFVGWSVCWLVGVVCVLACLCVCLFACLFACLLCLACRASDPTILARKTTMSKNYSVSFVGEHMGWVSQAKIILQGRAWTQGRVDMFSVKGRFDCHPPWNSICHLVDWTGKPQPH